MRLALMPLFVAISFMFAGATAAMDKENTLYIDLKDGRVVIVRGQHSAVYPTQAMLVASTNPCSATTAIGPACAFARAPVADSPGLSTHPSAKVVL